MDDYKVPISILVMGLMFFGMSVSAGTKGATVTLAILSVIFILFSGLYFWMTSEINNEKK